MLYNILLIIISYYIRPSRVVVYDIDAIISHLFYEPLYTPFAYLKP